MTENGPSYIVSGPEDNYDMPMECFGKIIFDRLRKRSATEVIHIDAVTGDVMTNGRLLENSIKLTTIFKQFGIQKGDTVAIVSENTVNYCVVIVAALYMGVTLSPLNPAYTTEELIHGLSHSKSKLIICSETTLQMVLKVKEQLKFVETVLILERSQNNPEIPSIGDLLKDTVTDIHRFRPEELDYSKQGAFILLSAGTTGLSKGVLLTHQNIRSSIAYEISPSYGNSTAKDTTLQVLPYFHVFGLLLELVAIIAGMKSVVIDKFNPDLFLKSIQDHKVTKLFLVPPLLLFLVKSPIVEKFDVSSIRDILVGAAPVGKELQSEAKKRMSCATIRQVYGLTETGGICAIQTPNFNKPGSAGVLVPGIIGKVWNAETNETVGPFKFGELCFKGPMIMKGYTGNTDACLDEGGFYHTGDVGYYDDDKFFYIVERMKELIKYKAFQVPPAELEAVLLSHPCIKDCGVIGIPDERAGQVPLAFVVRQNDTNVTEQEIVQFVAEKTSVQKRLYGGVKFVEEIPKNAAGKLLRRKLVEIYQSMQKTS